MSYHLAIAVQRLVKTETQALRSWSHQCMSVQSVMPNPLVELTRYGMAPGPRGAYVHLAPRGPGATPPLSAHRER